MAKTGTLSSFLRVSSASPATSEEGSACAHLPHQPHGVTAYCPPPLTLMRTCEERPPRISRANSAERARPTNTNAPPRTPRSLRGGRFIGPTAESLTKMLVSKDNRVCESTRFIRMDYTIEHQVGAGRFATVRMGICRKTGEKVAIKTLHRSDKFFNLEAVREEIALMRSLEDERNCIRLLAVYEDWENVYLVQELASGHLAARIQAVNAQFRESEVALLIAQVLSALDALHRNLIAHRDIKFENLLVMSHDTRSEQYNEVKLCDFGLCQALGARRSAACCGSKQFWAPEVVKAFADLKAGNSVPAPRDDLKADMWAVGHVLYTLLYGVEPFKNEDDVIMFPKIMRGAQFPEVSKACSGAQDLCRRLLSLDPKVRPSTQEALQEPWLREQFSPREVTGIRTLWKVHSPALIHR